MLLNSESQIPDTFYIFVNRYNPITVHNLRLTRQFTSAGISNCEIDKGFLEKYMQGTVNYLPYEPCNRKLGVVSPYCVTAISDYSVEYDAEYYRSEYYPSFPSRLSAIYAFGDYESCQLVHQKYHWDLNTVRKFKLINTPPLTRVVKVNMEIVSLSRLAYKISSLDHETREFIWRNYWSGSGNITSELPGVNFKREVYSSGEIYEYLIEGIVELDALEQVDALPSCI